MQRSYFQLRKIFFSKNYFHRFKFLLTRLDRFRQLVSPQLLYSGVNYKIPRLFPNFDHSSVPLKKWFFINFALILSLSFSSAYSQISYGGFPASLKASLPKPKAIELESLDLQPLLAEDFMNDKMGKPPRIGVSREVSISLADYNHLWIEIPGNTQEKVWRMAFKSKGALNINVSFHNFHLAPGSELYVYDTKKELILGQFNARNNPTSGIFSVSNLPGDEIIIELIERSEITIKNGWKPSSNFTVSQIGHFYRFNAFDEENKVADPCHVNINCPEGDNWQREKRGVARIILKDGSDFGLCTGSLINNTANDGRVLFITADHCGETSSEADFQQWQFRFNYERSSCISFFSPPNQNLTGSLLLAKAPINGGTDFKLLELTVDSFPKSFKPYYNGWDRSITGSANGVGIHHPDGDVKKISTYTTTLGTGTFPGGLLNGFWRVAWAQTVTNWGTTQGGSSGSPLFSSNKRIVGTLTGGNSSCTNQPFGRDLYGKLDLHWNENGIAENQQLAPFLDPEGTDTLFIDGYDPYFRWLKIETNQPYEAFSFDGEATNIRPNIWEFEKGDTITVSALENIPETAWVFEKWIVGNEEITEASVSVILDEDTTIEAVYMLSPDAVSLSFIIVNEDGDPISDATISFNGKENNSGDYLITSALPNITYDYSILREGYIPFESQVTLSEGNANQTIDVVMLFMRYAVTFSITDAATDEEITDAIIRISGVTYNEGEYVIDMVPGDYIYSVIHNNYISRHGQLMMTEEPQTVEVELLAIDTSVPFAKESGITLNPNPANQLITVQSAYKIFKINIYNLNGNLLFTENVKEINNQYDLYVGNLENSVYIVEIYTDNGPLIEKLLIFR
jgi:hypothetical protein